MIKLFWKIGFCNGFGYSFCILSNLVLLMIKLFGKGDFCIGFEY